MPKYLVDCSSDSFDELINQVELAEYEYNKLGEYDNQELLRQVGVALRKARLEVIE